MARSRILSAAIAAAAGVIVLCALGIWQLERLAWKEDLLSRLAARQAAAPVAYQDRPHGPDTDFTKITVTGTFRPQDSKFLMAVYDGGPGWEVVTPLVTGDASLLLVDRGVIPAGARDRILAEPAAGSRDLTGILRLHEAPRGFFTPENDVAGNNWYWWDIPAMLATMQVPAGPRPEPLVLQLLPGPGAAEFPAPQPAAANLTNNHLQYAITWFSLAAALAVVTLLFIRGQMKKTTA